ncbi:MAG: thiamine pyrophosphate-dependent dehydrogenase E1 component subunit alpha [Elusimicrobiota bacterium]|nr:thiamine pyrophosphate-dependent dehydrogenase E1 component subunit alpha [Elusimicrobiota bacterium]
MPSKPASSSKNAGSDPYKTLGSQRLFKIHELMVRARLLEERLIKMSKGGDGFFWIGGPGEEAFNVSLGLQVKKGHGVDHDFLHLHYRSSAIVLAMGAKPIDSIRQMRSVATDPYSKGRNFVNHYAIPELNVVPVSPTIETQYSTVIGTGIAQARAKTDAVSIVNGGDAGTAEGDFHTCLVWANRPVLPLPVLMIVVNNGYGISTEMKTQHGEKQISDWAKVFPDMPGKTIDGNSVVESWAALEEAFAYVRKNRRPYLLEARTSRLYGHSSSSGANRINEPDCITLLEKAMTDRGMGKAADFKKTWEREAAAIDEAHKQVKQEPFPKPESVWEDVFADGLPPDYPTKGGS